jgi:hypothetical protein
MKPKFFFMTLFLCLGLAMTGVSLSGCSAGAHIGPVGAGGSVS